MTSSPPTPISAAGTAKKFTETMLTSRAWDINDGGLIIGQMVVSGLGDRAFLHDGTQFIDLGTPAGGTFSRGRGINDIGEGVGTWGSVAGNPALAAFLWHDGVMVDLNAQLGTQHSEAKDINETGQVVGWMGTALADAHAFIWHAGKVTDLGVIPGGFTAAAEAINNSGWVAGSGRVRIEEPPFIATRAFLWNGSTMLYLGTLPGFDLGGASDVNDTGQVVGRAWTFDNLESAFIWQNGTMTDLNDLIVANAGVHITWATAINNQGQITGQADADNGDVVAVLLTPIEPPVGDLDGDGQVGVIDFLMLLSLWGPCLPACPPSCVGDLDGDCAVGVIDFLSLLAHWG